VRGKMVMNNIFRNSLKGYLDYKIDPYFLRRPNLSLKYREKSDVFPYRWRDPFE
jgi:hypothetical protein